MSLSRPSRLSDERGAALPFALLAIIVLAGLVTTMVSTAVSEQRVTGRAQSYESAVHVAEAGTDRVIEHINGDIAGEWASGDIDGLSYAYPAPPPADEEAWAIGRFEAALAADSPELVATSEGVALGIRPVDASGTPMDVIFGVGRTAAGLPAERTRVVRLRFDRGFFSPAHAICTNGLLTSSGSVDIDGVSGSVHSNTGVNLGGASGVITGALTSATSVYDPGGYTIGDLANSGPDKPFKDCGPIDARRIYTQRGTYIADGNLPDDDGDGVPDDWYDLCPDQSVRLSDPAGNTPCSGTVLMSDASSTAYNGWRYQAGEWRLVGNDPYPGVYYAYQRNVQINGAPGSVGGTPEQYTIISEAVTHCASPNMTSGSIKMGGNAKLTPRLPNLLFIADVDLLVSGTSGAELNGYMGANEQVVASGNFALNGSVAADEECNPANTPVTENKIGGGIHITFDGGTPVLLPGVVRITAWNEL